MHLASTFLGVLFSAHYSFKFDISRVQILHHRDGGHWKGKHNLFYCVAPTNRVEALPDAKFLRETIVEVNRTQSCLFHEPGA